MDFTDWMTASAAARRLGVTQRSVYLWVRSGRLEALRTPLGVLVARASVEKVAADRLARTLNRLTTLK
jgi:excisionase family DNA binding protein